jgi:hypothetical protein
MKKGLEAILLKYFISDHAIVNANSDEDLELRKLEEDAFISCYDAAYGKNYYELTLFGRKALGLK